MLRMDIHQAAPDLSHDLQLKPLHRTLIPTGIAIALPFGFEAQIRPRSGLARLGVLSTFGTLERKVAKDFVDREIVPFATEWDRTETMDKGIVGKLAETGRDEPSSAVLRSVATPCLWPDILPGVEMLVVRGDLGRRGEHAGGVHGGQR